MAWKVYVTYGAPKAKIVWDNVLYRTTLRINGQEVKPGEEVPINLLAGPKISLSLVAENEGDTGMCWVVIGLKERERVVPLFLKQDVLKPGDIIVGHVEYVVDFDFMDYVNRVTGRRDVFSIAGYVGHGDLLAGLSVYGERLPPARRVILPLAYVRSLETRRVFQAYDIDDVFKAIETIATGGRTPTVEIISIQPIEIECFGIKIRVRAADAGFDLYHLYRYYGGDFRRSGIELPIDKDISAFLSTESDDSTEVV